MSLKQLQRGQDAGAASRRGEARGKAACLPTERLRDLASRPLENLPERQRRHIEGCLRCAFDFVVFRAAHVLYELPPRWTVHLGTALRALEEETTEACQQLLGRISFETQEFASCREEDWVSSPLALRLNLVVDQEMKFFSVTILDAPASIEGVALMTSSGLKRFQSDDDGASFELLVDGTEDALRHTR